MFWLRQRKKKLLRGGKFRRKLYAKTIPAITLKTAGTFTWKRTCTIRKINGSDFPPGFVENDKRATDRPRDVFRDFSQPELTAGLQFLDLTADFANFDLREFERGFGRLRSNER